MYLLRVERVSILSKNETIEAQDFEDSEPIVSFETINPEDKTLRAARAVFEKQFITKMLTENGGNISKTAASIGVERSHLHKKMKIYGIEMNNSNLGSN